MSADPTITAEDNKQVVRRLFAAFAACDDREMDEVLAPDFIAHNMPPGLSNDAEGMKQSAALMHVGLRDCRNEIEDLVAEGDKVVARYTTRATHAGELFGAPASGRPVTMTGMELYRVANGKVAEYWGEYNISELYEAASATADPQRA